jgi:hypothetical protein
MSIFVGLGADGAKSFAQRVSTMTIELSAQQEQQTKKIVTPQRAAPSRVKPYINAPQRVVPHQTPAQVTVPGHVTPKLASPRVTGPKFVVPGGTAKNSATPSAGVIVAAPDATGPSIGASKTVQTFTPHGPNARVVTMSRLRGLPAIGVGRALIRGQSYSIWRHGYRTHYHGSWYTCVGLGALPAILIAANEFYPFAYIEAPEPYCDGLTEDGCQLVWQDVETQEGDVIPQCMAYCP